LQTVGKDPYDLFCEEKLTEVYAEKYRKRIGIFIKDVIKFFNSNDRVDGSKLNQSN